MTLSNQEATSTNSAQEAWLSRTLSTLQKMPQARAHREGLDQRGDGSRELRSFFRVPSIGPFSPWPWPCHVAESWMHEYTMYMPIYLYISIHPSIHSLDRVCAVLLVLFGICSHMVQSCASLHMRRSSVLLASCSFCVLRCAARLSSCRRHPLRRH